MLVPNKQARNLHCSLFLLSLFLCLLFLLSLFLCLLFLRSLFLGVKAPSIAKFILFTIPTVATLLRCIIPTINYSYTLGAKFLSSLQCKIPTNYFGGV
jgi:hypothetical protein